MNKLIFALMIWALLITTGCSMGNSGGRGSSMSLTVSTQQELDEGNQRIDEFKQELKRQGFVEISSSASNLKDQVVLKGDYGTLKNLEVTLWTGKQLASKEPHLGIGIHAYPRDPEAEHVFSELEKIRDLAVIGRPE